MQLIRLSLCFLFIITNIFANRTYEFTTPDGALALVHPLYGIDTITEPVLIDLIQSKEVQRLKKINQYGASEFLSSVHYTRYDHSIGVFMLLRRYQASIYEQIAGLLHDVSHTIFSHTGDWLFQATKDNTEFNPGNSDSFQDDMHFWYLSNSSIKPILNSYEIPLEKIMHKNGDFLMFEQSLPDLCMDRIEYNIYGGYIENYLSKADVEFILENLFFDGARWYLTSITAAKKLAQVSMDLSEHSYTSIQSNVISYLIVDLLKRAQVKNIINLDDILFSTDELVWYQLEHSVDPEIQEAVKRVYNHDLYHVSDRSCFDVEFSSKARVVDPYIKLSVGLVRLSELDPEFAQSRDAYKARITAPKYIKFDFR